MTIRKVTLIFIEFIDITNKKNIYIAVLCGAATTIKWPQYFLEYKNNMTAGNFFFGGCLLKMFS